MVAPHFVAGAAWEHDDRGWSCTAAAPIIQWMVGRDPTWVRSYLRRRRWEWTWLPARGSGVGSGL